MSRRKDDPEIIASHAKRLLEDDLLWKVVDGIKRRIVDELSNNDLNDYATPNETRDRMIIRLQTIEELKRWVKNTLEHANYRTVNEELKKPKEN